MNLRLPLKIAVPPMAIAPSQLLTLFVFTYFKMQGTPYPILNLK